MTSPFQRLERGVTPIIMHLEKSGGSTLKPVIVRQYRTPYSIDPFGPKTPAYFMDLPEAERAKFDVIVGHLFYGLHRHVPGATRYVTMMRHPLPRILSSYAYMGQRGRKNSHLYATDQMPWATHLENRRDDIRQLSRIVGGDDTQIRQFRIHDLPENATDVAIEHLENDFAMVGLQEHYDASLLMMRYILNWTQPITYIRLNESKRRIKLDDLSLADQKLVKQAAEVEMPVYEYAKKRFEAQKEAYPGDIERDVAQFRADNERYAQRQALITRIKTPFRAVRRSIRRLRSGK